ncbi:MAG: SDR family oxidoreductase [SAR324 cluster bacterium]|nr:SDR family oxidoreductase [SAR324 cluster bacterium]
MKKALVTGAGGFIGSHVAKVLLDQGVEVRAVLRPGESPRNLEGLPLEIMMGDILDKTFLRRCIKDIDTVFHLAGIYSIWMPDWKPLYEVNLQGTRNIMWASLENNVKKVVFTSSISALGIEPGTNVANEETEFNQYDANPYVLSKYLSQQEVIGFSEHGLNVVVVNPAFPFGPGDRSPTPTGQLILNLLKGVHLNIKGGFNAVDVRDVAIGHILAAEHGKRGEKYILGNRDLTISEFAEIVAEVSPKKLRTITVPLPKLAMEGAAHILKMVADHYTHKTPLSTPAEVRYISQYIYVDNNKAQRELGFAPRDVGISIRDSIEWFYSNGYVD